MVVPTAVLALLVPSLSGCSGGSEEPFRPVPTRQRGEQRATTAQVTILSPVDTATLTASPLAVDPHHRPMGGDWAADISGGGAAYARFANPSGPLVLTVEGEAFDPCGVANSGGLGVNVAVTVGGTPVGTVTYLHMETVEVRPGVIPNGARLGPMVTDPPVTSRCWGNTHTHVEAGNNRAVTDKRSCFVRRNINTWVDYATPLGVLGGQWADSVNQVCPAGVEDGADPSRAASYDPVGHLDSAARVTGGVRVLGWARDEDAPGRAITVQGLIDGEPAGQASAGGGSDLVPPTFDFFVPADPRPHDVCVRAVNVGGGSDVTLENCIPVAAATTT